MSSSIFFFCLYFTYLIFQTSSLNITEINMLEASLKQYLQIFTVIFYSSLEKDLKGLNVKRQVYQWVNL